VPGGVLASSAVSSAVGDGVSASALSARLPSRKELSLTSASTLQATRQILTGRQARSRAAAIATLRALRCLPSRRPWSSTTDRQTGQASEAPPSATAAASSATGPGVRGATFVTIGEDEVLLSRQTPVDRFVGGHYNVREKAEHHVLLGDLKKARRALEHMPARIMDATGREQLASKHPPQDEPEVPVLPPEAFRDTPFASNSVLFEFVRSTLSRCNLKSAPGMDGLTFGDLSLLLHDPSTRSSLLPWASNALHGKLRTYQELSIGRLIGIGKNDDGDLRPIAVNSAAYRLAAAMAYRLAIEFDQVHKLPCMKLQFALNVKDGTIRAANAVRMAVAASISRNPDGPTAVLCLDCSNAFNTGDRTAMLKNWAELSPLSFRVMAPFYSHHSPLYLQGSDGRTYCIRSQAGQRQGDNTGSLAFCMMMEPFLLPIREAFSALGVTIITYADDITVVGPARPCAAAAAAVVRALLARCGLRMGAGKCSAHCCDDDSQRTLAEVVKHAELSGLFGVLPATSSMAIVVGCPVSLHRSDRKRSRAAIGYAVARIARFAGEELGVVENLTNFIHGGAAARYFHTVLKSQLVFDVRAMAGFGEAKRGAFHLFELFLKAVFLKILRVHSPAALTAPMAELLAQLGCLPPTGPALIKLLGYKKSARGWAVFGDHAQDPSQPLSHAILSLRLAHGGFDLPTCDTMCVASSEAFVSSCSGILLGDHDLGEHPFLLSDLTAVALQAVDNIWRADTWGAASACHSRAVTLSEHLAAIRATFATLREEGCRPSLTGLASTGGFLGREADEAVVRGKSRLEALVAAQTAATSADEAGIQLPVVDLDEYAFPTIDSNAVRTINIIDHILVVIYIASRACAALRENYYHVNAWWTAALAWLMSSQGTSHGMWVFELHERPDLRLSPGEWRLCALARLLRPSVRDDLLSCPVPYSCRCWASSPNMPHGETEHAGLLTHDTVFSHVVGCTRSRGNKATACHNRVARILGEALRSAGYETSMEPYFRHSSAGEPALSFAGSKRPDIHATKGGQHIYIDVVIVNPACMSRRDACAKDPDAATRSGDLSKRQVYSSFPVTAPLVERGELVPFSATSTGRLGSPALALLRSVVSRRLGTDATHADRDSWRHWWNISFSSALAKGLAQQLEHHGTETRAHVDRTRALNLQASDAHPRGGLPLPPRLSRSRASTARRASTVSPRVRSDAPNRCGAPPPGGPPRATLYLTPTQGRRARRGAAHHGIKREPPPAVGPLVPSGRVEPLEPPQMPHESVPHRQTSSPSGALRAPRLPALPLKPGDERRADVLSPPRASPRLLPTSIRRPAESQAYSQPSFYELPDLSGAALRAAATPPLPHELPSPFPRAEG